MSAKSSRGAGMFLVLGLMGLSLFFLAFLADEAGRQGFEVFLAGSAVLSGIGVLLLRGPVGKAIASMLEGGTPTEDAQLSARMAELEDRVQELSLEAQRFMEIEDRLEFAERMIAEQSSRRLEAGDGR